MRISVCLENHGPIYGTLTSISTKNKGMLFVLKADNSHIGIGVECTVIERATLPALVAEAERQGLWDIEPI